MQLEEEVGRKQGVVEVLEGAKQGLESELAPMKCTTATNNAEMCTNKEHIKRRKYPSIIEFSEGECCLSKSTPFQESMHSAHKLES